MKTLLILATVLMTVAPAFAVEKCKFKLNDLSKDAIVATGATRDEALANAANKCFDMYQEATLRRSGHGLQDDDQGVSIANACTNVRCG